MTLSLATATANAAADAVGTLLSAGTVEIRSGSRPATANDAATGTLLASVTLGTATSASSGQVTFGDPASVNAAATGTASWFRAKASGGATVFDGDVGVSVAVTATASTDLLTTSSTHGLLVGHYVIMASGIAGVSAGRYVVIEVPSSTTFKIALPGQSSVVNITSDGSGSYSTAELVLSSTSLTSGNPVDLSSFAYVQPA